MRAFSFFATSAAAALAAGLCGCATSSPLLVEPRSVAPGEVRAQVGAAGMAPIGGDRSALVDARAALADSTTKTTDVGKIDPGVAMLFGAHPGVAPVVRAQVGLHERVEGNIRYGGRDVGTGVRFIFYDARTENAGATTLSIGAEARAVLMGRPDDGILPGAFVDNVKGWGGTIPFIAAWQSDAGLVFAYAGAAVGADRVTGRVAFTGIDANAPFLDAAVTRLFAAATLGLGVGFRKLHIIAELGLERDLLHSTIAQRSTDVRLYSLMPGFVASFRL